MDFDAKHIHQLEEVLEGYSYVVEVTQQPFGADVRLAAEDHILVYREIVIKIGGFVASLAYEVGQCGFRFAELAGFDFEVRVDGDDLRWMCHGEQGQEVPYPQQAFFPRTVRLGCTPYSRERPLLVKNRRQQILNRSSKEKRCIQTPAALENQRTVEHHQAQRSGYDATPENQRPARAGQGC